MLEIVAVKSYGRFRLEVDMKVGREWFVLLGPNGAGKTTLLKMIAGIVRPDKGRIVLEGEDITEVPPENRRIGYIPQSLALFPHMTVEKNISFGLRGLEEKEKKRRVREVAELLGIENILDRYPKELSGGQQQRVAIARALAIKPKVLLMDEPFSSIDPEFRSKIVERLKEIKSDLDLTIISVTHDLEEAMKTAERLGIISGGKILQIGRPEEVFENPKCEEVARFLGYNVANGESFGLDGKIAFKPSDVSFGSGVRAKVVDCRWIGYSYHLTLEVDGFRFYAVSNERPKGESVEVKLRRFVRLWS